MLLWYAAGLIAALAIAWLAAALHLSGHAPVGLISLAVGAATAHCYALAASQRLAGRKRLILGTLLLSLVTVLAQHAWLYRDFRRQWHQARANSPEVALFRPESPPSPGEYFGRELTPGRAALWGLDAVLIIVAATATVLILARRHQMFPNP